MDLLAIFLLILAVALVASSWIPVGKKAVVPAGASLQSIMSVVLTVIIVPLGLYVIFIKADATAFQAQSAAGLLGTCVGYWFKR